MVKNCEAGCWLTEKIGDGRSDKYCAVYSSPDKSWKIYKTYVPEALACYINHMSIWNLTLFLFQIWLYRILTIHLITHYKSSYYKNTRNTYVDLEYILNTCNVVAIF
jgi:hypothetical protein